MTIVERIYKNLFVDDRYLLVFEGVKNTLLIALLACLLGGVIAIIICSLRLSKSKIAVILAKIYIYVFRGIPIVLLLLLTYYVIFANIGISAIAVSIIAFSIYHSAYAAEIFRSGLNSVHDKQIEASIALGFKKWQTFLYIVIPQAIRVIFPVYKGEVMTLIKITSVVGFIGVCDLTRAADIIRSQTFDAVFPLVFAVIVYFIIIGIVSLILDMIEKKINNKKG